MTAANWVFLILGLLLSIPVGIIINLLTPRIQRWLDQRAISTRGKTLAQLKADLQHIENLHSNPSSLWYKVAGEFAKSLAFLIASAVFLMIGISALMLGISFIAVSPPPANFLSQLGMMGFSLILILVGAAVPIIILTQLARDFTRLEEYESYTERLAARIAELESRKPEDKAT